MSDAREHYENLLPKLDTSEFFSIRKPEIITVLEGTEAGLESLKDFHNMKDLYRLQLENDISNYQGGGISEFFPWSYFFDTNYHEYYIKIPTHCMTTRFSMACKMSSCFMPGWAST